MTTDGAAPPPGPDAGPDGDWDGGWWRPARRVDSPNFGPRPGGVALSLIVVHSISLPPGCYGGDEVERLFTNRLDCDAHAYFDRLRGLEVSAHFFVRRTGEVVQFVDVGQRAWHAGASQWHGRTNCNDFSVGIELEGLEGETFEAAQYASLATLCEAIAQQHPVAHIVGHEHIAPGRKLDPGPGFDWADLQQRLPHFGGGFPELLAPGAGTAQR